MAPVPKDNMEHFTHPGHQLVKLSDGKEYLCDRCKTVGSGTKYRCGPCDFDLHEYCATCPMTQSSFMHPHDLTLVIQEPRATPLQDRTCDVCGGFVEGLFYRCKGCDFDVHPLCTRLPQSVRHMRHIVHPLTLQSTSTTGCCNVCYRACTSWRYRCGVCGFDIHMECILSAFDKAAEQEQSSTLPSFGIPPRASYGKTTTAAPAFGIHQPLYGFNYPMGARVPPASDLYINMYKKYLNLNAYNYAYQAQAQAQIQAQVQAQIQAQVQAQARQQEKKNMFALVGKLASGVLSNTVFGGGNMDFSSFM